MNCGGNTYKDAFGNTWLADIPFSYNKQFGSSSWADEYTNVPAAFASQGNNNDPVKATTAWPLFQSFRYGLNKLKYDFPVTNGDYIVELCFAEPWHGLANVNAKGWRLFDVAINNNIVAKDIDVFAEAGYNHAIKKTFRIHVKNGKITISFPNEKAGQAVIMAIAIATENKAVGTVNASPGIIQDLQSTFENSSVQYWMNTGDTVFTDQPFSFVKLPSALYGGEWIKTPLNSSNTCSFTVSTKADVYVAFADSNDNKLNDGFSSTNTNIYTADTDFKKWKVYKKRFDKNSKVNLQSNHPFIIAVNEVVTLPASYDLRNVVTYNIKAATTKGNGFTKDSLYKKYAVHFSREANDTIQWKIPIGVAGMYAVRLRYRTDGNEPSIIKIFIHDANGNIMKAETLQLPAYQKEKWGTFETNTGSYINAGNYTISLHTVNAKGLSLSSIEIQ